MLEELEKKTSLIEKEKLNRKSYNQLTVFIPNAERPLVDFTDDLSFQSTELVS